MPLLPPRLSARWLLVFVVTAALLAAGLLWVGTANSGRAPAQDVVLSVVGVSGGIAAVLSLLGAFGARASFACALLGLLIGLAQMIYVALAGSEGMADLAALASFMMYGAIGLGVGALIDLGRWIGGRGQRSG
jgi:hypothetical protein